MVGIISVVIGGHFGGGDHFDGGDHFGGGTPALRRSHSSFLSSLSNDKLTCDCFNFALLFSLAKRFLQAKLLTPPC